ncbi:MAG: two-component regulator propeller domain-containing protein, partial [Tannerellaceae bacterium]
MKQYITILYLLGLLLSGTFLYAEVKPEYYFKQISVGEGLSKSMVRCVLTDHKGLMWIGTRFGLNTFDGERVQSYYHHKGGNRSLPFNDIRFLHEDSLLNLWIGTEQELSLYDRENDRFVPVFSKGKKLNIYSFLPVTGGVLLFGRGEVFKYQYADKHIIPLTVHSNEKMTSPFDRACIWDEAAGVVLLSCRWNGLWRYTLGSGLLERVPFVKDRQIGTVCMDSSGCMWVSPYGEGLMGYDRSGRMLCHLTVSGGELTNDVILDIRERGDKLWLATDGGGINLYDKKNHSMQVIKHVPGNTNSLPVNSYWCLYSDPENNIWAGSVRGGLIGIKEVYMRTYKDAPLNTSYGLSEKAVVGMFEDKAGFIWLGTDGGGINRLDPHTGLFNHYPSTYSTKVISIIDYTETELLLSLFGQGLYLFNK